MSQEVTFGDYLLCLNFYRKLDDKFFFFNHTATTEIYTVRNTLSLHDALPISASPPTATSASASPRAPPRGPRPRLGPRVLPSASPPSWRASYRRPDGALPPRPLAARLLRRQDAEGRRGRYAEPLLRR